MAAVQLVISRARSCERLGNIQQRLGELCPFSQPKFIVVNDEEQAVEINILHQMALEGFSFPVICKPVEACGTPNSHCMVSNQIRL